MIGDEYKNYTFSNIMNILMGETSDEVDKRQGGLFYDIYTAVSSFGALVFNALSSVAKSAHPITAQNEYLDLCADDVGIVRLEATNAVKKVYVFDINGEPFDVDLGLFVTPKGNGNLLYALIEKEDVGVYKAQCSTLGKVGNSYIGDCDLLANISNIGSVYMNEVLVSARDEETDEELRIRIKEASIGEGFGGNIIDYRSLVGTKLKTVGQMQVYSRDYGEPILNSIVVSIVDNDYNPFSQTQLDEISELLDPSSYPGGGRGMLPFGHHPLVVSPTEKTIDISLTIVPEPSHTTEELKNDIVNKVSEYINDVRKNWAYISDYGAANLFSVIIYQAQIIAKVLEVDGVLSVSSVIINSEDADCILSETKALQEIPIIGSIDVA